MWSDITQHESKVLAGPGPGWQELPFLGPILHQMHLEPIMSLNNAKTLEGETHPQNDQSCGQGVVNLYQTSALLLVELLVKLKSTMKQESHSPQWSTRGYSMRHEAEKPRHKGRNPGP